MGLFTRPVERAAKEAYEAFREAKKTKGNNGNYEALLRNAEMAYRSIAPHELRDSDAVDLYFAPYGAVLLELGKLEDAQRVFETGLSRYRHERLEMGLEAVKSAFRIRELDELLKKENLTDEETNRLLEFARGYESGIGEGKLRLTFGRGSDPLGSLTEASRYRDTKELEIYDKVLQAKPDDIRIRKRRADLLKSPFVKRYDEAMEEYEKLLMGGLIQDEHDLWWINCILGYMYSDKSKNSEKALKHYSDAQQYAERLGIHGRTAGSIENIKDSVEKLRQEILEKQTRKEAVFA